MTATPNPTEYHDRAFERRSEEGSAPSEPVLEFVRELGHAERALDLGCGDGALTAALDAADLTAADVSLVALKRARERLPDATLLLLMPDQPLPFEDESFDLVLCAETLPYVKDLFALVLELRRVLAPGGTLAVTAPAHGRRDGLRMLFRGIEETLDPHSPEIRFFSWHSLGELLDSAGFAPIYLNREHRTLLATAHR